MHQSDVREIIKSVGNSTTTPRDLDCAADVRLVLMVLSESVAARLREYGLRCSTVQISIRDNRLTSIERQQKMEQATDLARDIVRQALAAVRTALDLGKPDSQPRCPGL